MKTEPCEANAPGEPNIPHKRFLTEKPETFATAIAAAQAYVANLKGGEIDWLYYKPFDPTPGNAQYFRLMYDLLNLLQAMQLPAHARILEVGSGPGWVTEILTMLGHSVTALEPSADLNAIAQARCTALASHFQHQPHTNPTFHQTTLEEVEFPEAEFDAILFFDVLHHVVNETLALRKCFKFLKPGGSVGITEGAWHPDFKNLETTLINEMARFGTLENPFSSEYIDHLLESSGFIDIQRYVAVNGYFTARQLTQPLQNFGTNTLTGLNNITARKPDANDTLYPSCAKPGLKTLASVTLLSGGIQPTTRTATLEVRITNSGATRLDHRPNRPGHITVALRHGAPGAPSFIEARERHPLSSTLIPGNAVTMNLTFTLPAHIGLDGWELDLIAEELYWFSTRAALSAPTPCPTLPTPA
jgi:SAM-dependent methyltransferase